MKKYEYKVIELSHYLDEQEISLQEYGAEGWELVSVTPAKFRPNPTFNAIAYMKREIGSDQTNSLPINY